jgi:dienelactone hydrolase
MTRAQEKARQQLAAGATLEFTFPELPPTLHAMRTGDRSPTRAAVHLPRDYSRRKRFPLLVYLEGGRGAPGDRTGLAKVRRIAGSRGFIAASLPLFKKALDPRETHAGLLIAAYDDYPRIARAYSAMLRRILAAIPNIDPNRSALGGFSNGAHTTALLLSGLHAMTLRCFRHFYLIDGGGYLTSFHKAALADKNFLFMVGAVRGDRRRRAWLRLLEANCALAREKLRKVTLHRMPGVGHGFPDRCAPFIRRWICRMNGPESVTCPRRRVGV